MEFVVHQSLTSVLEGEHFFQVVFELEAIVFQVEVLVLYLCHDGLQVATKHLRVGDPCWVKDMVLLLHDIQGRGQNWRLVLWVMDD